MAGGSSNAAVGTVCEVPVYSVEFEKRISSTQQLLFAPVLSASTLRLSKSPASALCEPTELCALREPL